MKFISEYRDPELVLSREVWARDGGSVVRDMPSYARRCTLLSQSRDAA